MSGGIRFDEDERTFPGALRIPIDELPHRLAEIPKGTTDRAELRLTRRSHELPWGAPPPGIEGHENVYALEGGWHAWLAGEYPVSVQEPEMVAR